MRHALSISMWAILMIGGPVLAQTSGTDDVFSDVSQDSTSKVVDPDVVLATKITFQASAEQSNIGHLCRELADMVPEVNFVVGPDAARVQLPDLDFENLSLATVLQLIPEITKQRVSMDFNSIEQRSEDENLVVIVMKNDVEEPLQTRVLSVKQLLGGMDKEALMEAFDDGLRFIGSETKPEIGFHERTGLLFVRGTPQQTQFLMEMVSAMQASQMPNYFHGPGMPSMPGMEGMGMPGGPGASGFGGGPGGMGPGGSGFPGGGFPGGFSGGRFPGGGAPPPAGPGDGFELPGSPSLPHPRPAEGGSGLGPQAGNSPSGR